MFTFSNKRVIFNYKLGVSTRVWHFYRKIDQTYWTKSVSANLLRDKRGWVTSWTSENWLLRSSVDLMECDPCMLTTCSKKGWQSRDENFLYGLGSSRGFNPIESGMNEEYKLGMGKFSGMIFGVKQGWYFNPQPKSTPFKIYMYILFIFYMNILLRDSCVHHSHQILYSAYYILYWIK